MKARVIANALVIVVIGLTDAWGESITVDDFLSQVRQRHPFFIEQSLQPEIDAYEQERFLGDTDWILRSSPFVNFQQPIVANTFSPDRITRTGLNAQAERAYWGNGGRLALAWESFYTDQKQPGIIIPSSTGPIAIPVGPSTFYENRVMATYTYPLLQNRGGILDKLDYELGGEEVAFAKIQSFENQEDFLLAAAVRFVDWALTIEEMRIAEERLRFEEEQLDQIRRKRRANLVDEVDVLRAQNAVEVAQENLTFNRSRMTALKAGLAVLAKDPAINESSPDMDLYADETVPPLEQVLAGIPNQRTIRALRVRLEQLETQGQALANITKAELFLGASGGVQQGNASFAESWKLDKPDLTFFVEYRYPLGNRTAKADVSRNRAEIRKLESAIESASLNLEAELRKIWIEITELEKVLVLNQKQLETAREKTVAEQEVYDQGRSDYTFVIQSRDDVSLSQLRYAANAAIYQKLFLSYRALVDDLLPDEGQ